MYSVQDILAKLKRLVTKWQNKDVAEDTAEEDVLKTIGVIATQLLPPLKLAEQCVKDTLEKQPISLEMLKPLLEVINDLKGILNMSGTNNQFAILIHELRQPLAEAEIALELLIETISSGQVNDEERREWLLILQEGIQYLKGCTEVFSALASGDTLVKTSIDLVALVAREVERAGRSGNIQATLPDRTILVGGHKGAIQQVYRNLLGNARKYGRAPFEISIFEDAEKVVVSVRDHGDGIPPSELGHLRELGYRASNVEQQPGDGLGLWIVWLVVRAMNGSLIIENHPLGGAQVSFILPCAEHES